MNIRSGLTVGVVIVGGLWMELGRVLRLVGRVLVVADGAVKCDVAVAVAVVGDMYADAAEDGCVGVEEVVIWYCTLQGWVVVVLCCGMRMVVGSA